MDLIESLFEFYYYNRMKRNHYMNWQGFTLIELLVVVLIIGVLVSIALPQYQRAVEKGKTAQAIITVRALHDAGEIYHLANGDWPQSFDELAVDTPWTGDTKAMDSVIHVPDVRSNEEWSVEMQYNDGIGDYGIYVSRLTGPWAGTGFTMKWEMSSSHVIPVHSLLCFERIEGGVSFTGEADSYCNKIFNATYVGGRWLRYYVMP